MLVPYHLGKTKVCNLYLPDSTATNSGYEFAFGYLWLIPRNWWGRRNFGWRYGNWTKEKIFGFDVAFVKNKKRQYVRRIKKW